MEPSGAAPGRGEAFQDEALSFGRAGRKSSGLIRGEVAITHVGLPFAGPPLLAEKVFAVPAVVV